jgi:hypothetical protein
MRYFVTLWRHCAARMHGVDCVLDLIADALQSNERVDLRGFGSFVVKERKERQGRNPRTGETITIAPPAAGRHGVLRLDAGGVSGRPTAHRPAMGPRSLFPAPPSGV